MLVNEIFLSIQGEGPQLGLPAWFIRFSKCNLNCSFCDSKYARKGKKMSIEEIINKISNNNCKNVVLTGGEPTIQKDFSKIINELGRVGFKIYVETNGTIYTPMQIGMATFLVSPKLQFLNPKYLESLRGWAIHGSFKFVIKNKKDFDQAVQLCYQLKKFDDVYFMPMGTSEKVLKKRMLQMVEWIKELGWGQLTPRLQIELWGRKRGT